MKAFLTGVLLVMLFGCTKEPAASSKPAAQGARGNSGRMSKNDILTNLSESKRTKFGKEEFKFQSFPQKVFSAIWAAESEINNGGFMQYFKNASCGTAPFVAEAFRAIGAPQTAEICGRAIGIAFPSGLPVTSQEIPAAVANFTKETKEQLEKMDAAFLKYPHDLTDLLFAFVSKYPEEFGVLPEVKD